MYGFILYMFNQGALASLGLVQGVVRDQETKQDSAVCALLEVRGKNREETRKQVACAVEKTRSTPTHPRADIWPEPTSGLRPNCREV